MKIKEYSTREKQIHAAWAKLNQAADALESSRALVLMDESLRHLLADMPGGLSALADRAGIDAAGQALLAGVQALDREKVAFGLPNVGSVIPILWRIIRSEELRLQGEAPVMPLVARRLGQVALAAAGLAAAVLLVSVAVQAAVGAATEGASVTYYLGAGFERRIWFGAEPAMGIKYAGNKPVWFAPASGWSARWEADLVVPADGEYEFYTRADDGLRLFIDGTLLIDNWQDQDWDSSKRLATIALARGIHRIRVEHGFRSGHAAMRVIWSGGPIPAGTVVAVPHLRKPGGPRSD